VRNYLLRLGWSHGDQEIFSTEEAISLFDLSSVNRAAARFDLTKLESVNSQYLRETSSENLFLPVIKRLETETRRMLSDIEKTRVKDGLESLKSRAKTLVDLSEMAQIYLSGPPIIKSEKAEKMLSTEDALASLSKTLESLKTIEARDWNSSNIENMLRSTAEVEGLKLGNLAQPLRAALTGLDASPSLFEVAALLGKDETLLRIENLLP